MSTFWVLVDKPYKQFLKDRNVIYGVGQGVYEFMSAVQNEANFITWKLIEGMKKEKK